MTVGLPSALTGPSHHLTIREDSDVLAIFFSAKDMRAHQFNFWHAGHELDENLLFVNSPSNDWYLNGVPGLGQSFEDTALTMARWREALAVCRVVAVGTSMGGFAAIRYGSALGADVLAFSTDAVVRAAGSRSAEFFKGPEIPGDFDLRATLRDSAASVHLMVGEADPRDLYAAWLLSSSKAVTAISLIGANHYLPTHLTRQNRLIRMLRHFAQTGAVAAQPDAGHALEIHGVVEALHKAYLMSRQSDWAGVADHAREALRLYPLAEAAEFLMGMALLKLDRIEQATVHLSNAYFSGPEDMEVLFHLASAVRRLGHRDRARFLFRNLLNKQPGFAKAHFSLGIMALEDGDLTEAQRRVARAVALEPRNATFKERLSKIKERGATTVAG